MESGEDSAQSDADTKTVVSPGTLLLSDISKCDSPQRARVWDTASSVFASHTTG
jgi:hypothetical protein